MARKIDIYNKALLDLKETPLSQSDLGDSSNRKVQILNAYFNEAIQMASADDDWTFLDAEIDLVTDTETVDSDTFVSNFSTKAMQEYSYEEERKLLLVGIVDGDGKYREYLFRNISIDSTGSTTYVTYELVRDDGAKGDEYSHCFTLPDSVRRITHLYPEGQGVYRRVGSYLYTDFIPELVIGQTEDTADEYNEDLYPALYSDLIAHALAYVAGTAITNNDEKTMTMILRKFNDISMRLSNSDVNGGMRRNFQL